MQLLVPTRDQLGTVGGHDLVGSRVRPRAPVPGTSQLRARFFSGVVRSPFGLVSVDVARDLRSALAEPSGVRRELLDLASIVERVAAGGQSRAELRVAHDGGVADAVDRLDAVAGADRVERRATCPSRTPSR